MLTLEVPRNTGSARAAATYAAAVLHALARGEVAGRRPERLTESKRATWERFKGRLDAADLVRLLVEDGRVVHGAPFDVADPGGEVKLSQVSAAVAAGWLDALAQSDLETQLDLTAPGTEYVAAQAKLLGVPTRLGRSDLHVVKSHHKVLELPGTGGQLSHHLASTLPNVQIQDNFVIACSGWEERTLAGIVALELGAPRSDFVRTVSVADLRDPEHPIRKQSFDFVIGLHPDKGGLFEVEDQLAVWFASARCLLV